MGYPKTYFKERPGSPAPLLVTADRRIRFEEVDAAGMVWHGRYPSFLEDGRIAFGDRYGLAYGAFIRHRVLAPLVQMHLDYRSPLRFDQIIRIETSLHWNEALRLDFSYAIIDPQGQIATTGYTVQVLTDLGGGLLLAPPDWMLDFREQWRAGRFE
ncbi:MAG: acyl-CoA thioesterase [Desulfocapsaceae bacterium]|nr:acyl-CoA thioesterase [Desulfocapsaceae bacterium]